MTSTRAATSAGSRPPVNSPAIETPVDRADGDQHEARRDGLRHRARGGEQRHQLAGLRPAPLHLRKQHGRDRGHVGGLGAGDAGHQVHGAEQHVGEAAADMADQRRHEVDQHAREPRHLDQQAEKDEQRHRQQDQVGHALVDPAHHDGERHPGREGEIGKRRDAERERDRHAERDAQSDHSHEEDHEVEVADFGERTAAPATARTRSRARPPAR